MNKFIIKSKLDENFSVLPNAIVNRKGMSLKAKGLMWYLLSKPDNWELSIPDVINHSTEKRDAVETVIKELEGLGFLVKEHHRKKNGHFDGYDYFVFDTPQNSANTIFSPEREKPVLDKPVLVKRQQISTEVILSTEDTNNLSNKKYINIFGKDYELNSKHKIKFTYELQKKLMDILDKVYPKQLTGISDRTALESMWQAIHRRTRRDDWMDENPFVNLGDFLEKYTESTEEQFLVGTVYNLTTKLRDWRERGGK